jgi:hypothetical protein
MFSPPAVASLPGPLRGRGSTDAAAASTPEDRLVTFLALILKNVTRQRMRAALTVLGIGVGITTVVALGVIAAGFKATASEVLRTGGADFMVAQKGSADLSFSTLTAEDWRAVRRRPDVERATGVLFHITRAGDNPFFAALGIEPEDLRAAPPALRRGRLLSEGRGTRSSWGRAPPRISAWASATRSPSIAAG